MIVTNNPMVRETHATNCDIVASAINLRFVDGSADELLRSVRDMVYEGYPLVSHPLPASMRMLYSPYRSVVMGASAGPLNSWHVGIAEESLRKYRQNTAHRPMRKADMESTESYQWMDMQLLKATLQESASFN